MQYFLKNHYSDEFRQIDAFQEANLPTYTVSEYQYHTPSREERRFLYYNHLSKEFLERMMPHLKALI